MCLLHSLTIFLLCEGFLHGSNALQGVAKGGVYEWLHSSPTSQHVIAFSLIKVPVNQ